MNMIHLYEKEIERITEQIIEKFHPADIILFGSCAKQRIRKGSDIDICVIAETDNKRDLIQRILYEVDYDIDLDIVVYTPAEWDKYREDRACFANVIYRTGVNLIEPAGSLSEA